jgi:hypothetical protein
MFLDVSDFTVAEIRSLIMDAFRNGSLVEQFQCLDTNPMTSSKDKNIFLKAVLTLVLLAL